MALVKFARGTKANYNHTTYADYIYFAEDTGEILMNNQSYGGGSITNVEVVEGNSLKLTFSNGTSQTFDVADLLLYNSQLDDSVATVSALGGIAAGTTVADLKSKTLSQVFDDLIFPTVNPTFVAPTVTNVKTGKANLVKVGYTDPPTSAELTYTFNKGAINLGNKKQADRSGAETGHTNECKTPSGAYSTTFPETLSEFGTYTYRVTVNYAQGPQPKDSKGNNYSTPLAAGSVSSTATIRTTYPHYSNGASASKTQGMVSGHPEEASATPTEMDIVTPVIISNTNDGKSESAEIAIAFASEAKTGIRAIFDYAAARTLLGVAFFDTSSNSWKEADASTYAISDTDNKTVETVSVAYKRWTTNSSRPLSGPMHYRFYFSK